MKYFGIPYCPYCKKTINIVRVWSLKKSGEYMCPRCKGVSNVYLSPIIYILAVLAVGIGFLIYFFEKFILDNITLMTTFKVFLPFGIFFILSLFMVYLKKPVIRRIKKRKDGRFFDDNGKEFVMKFGRLVPMAENNQNVPQEDFENNMFEDFDENSNFFDKENEEE